VQQLFKLAGGTLWAASSLKWMVRESPAQPPPPPKTHPAEKVRGGEIILKTKARKTIFIVGLAGCMVLALLISLFAR
jgi:hypothetical protein